MVQLPCVELTERKFASSGMSSVTTTFVAARGPLFVTTSVYVTSSLGPTTAGAVSIVSDRSAVVSVTVNVVASSSAAVDGSSLTTFVSFVPLLSRSVWAVP